MLALQRTHIGEMQRIIRLFRLPRRLDVFGVGKERHDRVVGGEARLGRQPLGRVVVVDRRHLAGVIRHRGNRMSKDLRHEYRELRGVGVIARRMTDGRRRHGMRWRWQQHRGGVRSRDVLRRRWDEFLRIVVVELR